MTHEKIPSCVYSAGCVFSREGGCTGLCSERVAINQVPEQRGERHFYDDQNGGLWSHPGTREDCPLPECA